VEPRVPETVAARAALWATVLAISLFALYVPAAPKALRLVQDGTGGCRLAAPASAPACACASLPADARAALGLPLLLNTASAADLERVPGLGPVRASAIVAERERAGAFATLAALSARVPGIGSGTVDRIRPHVSVVGPDPACGAREWVEWSRLGASGHLQGGETLEAAEP
jgi:competence ComEA-like helix-hairpin-helix protein